MLGSKALQSCTAAATPLISTKLTLQTSKRGLWVAHIAAPERGGSVTNTISSLPPETPSSSVVPTNPEPPKPSPKPSQKSESSNAPPQPPNGSPEAAGEPTQIGMDPFTVQFIQALILGGLALGIANNSGVDLANSFTVDWQAPIASLPCAAPVLMILGLLCVPKWGQLPEGEELDRLQRHYFLVSQVLRVGGDDDIDDDLAEQARQEYITRELRLQQPATWTTISSALNLAQVYFLQPWNPPTQPEVAALAVAGRTIAQLAFEFLLRGAVYGSLALYFQDIIQNAEPSSYLLYARMLGTEKTSGLLAGLVVLAVTIPWSLWESRSPRDFVRASVVGPVRDAAMFCNGSGPNEPAYCDPLGFAFQAARNPTNATAVTTVVASTKRWRPPSESSMSSYSSLDEQDKLGPNPASLLDSTSSSLQAATAADVEHETQTAVTEAEEQDQEDDMTSAILTSYDQMEDEDLNVLLRVETLQDRIAYGLFSTCAVLSTLAVNGSFLLTHNLAASFFSAWLIRTLPLILVELRVRMTAARK